MVRLSFLTTRGLWIRADAAVRGAPSGALFVTRGERSGAIQFSSYRYRLHLFATNTEKPAGRGVARSGDVGGSSGIKTYRNVANCIDLQRTRAKKQKYPREDSNL